MTAPLEVTQKLAKALSMQNTGSNLSDFQNWLGVFPDDGLQYATQQVAVVGPTSDSIYVRRRGYPTVLLNNTDWLIVTELSNSLWTKLNDQDYQKSWG